MPSLLLIINQAQQGIIPKLQILNIPCSAIEMSQAQIMKVSEDWIEKMAVANQS